MSFTVTILPSGHQMEVEDDESVLDAALRQGYALPYGCRNGGCGSCMGKLITGEVDYGPMRPRALSEEDEAAGKALFCQAYAMTDLEIEVPEIGAVKDIVVKTLPARVVEMNRLNHDVMELRLKLPAIERLQFLAGQYIDILLRDGRRRSFSLANPPHRDETLELHVRHVPGGSFTTQVFETMKPKALVRIEGPLGTFFLREDSDRPILMMAGGTGFAPLQGMLEHVFAQAIDRPIHLYWGTRSREDLYRDEQVRAWCAEHTQLRYTPVLSEALDDTTWEGERGWVHETLLRDYPDLSAHDVYMSGPPPMIAAARPLFLAHGLPETQLFFDSFEFAEDAVE
ncbi:CDP-6-deoxy-delta-3,4-glucoseen reductase [Acidihalobacter ferrooxydans]|uniref:CDP-6-deoxy-delta-3,4-glucoseen reductase n=1 Tax=Acidihalobacter ferrooxydans TaxID=1765967 RepID=A0A1P8UCW3_9GAMM|nr:CDP-6-deoxy-delta-3,4-glucoseen reductase [Acidihalobacter ferrooxydans]APZ41692.1 CDP-6-deoxy-delta-3,4-glucoseen reductase [Acidihalobacter ferrooxydans]